METDGLELGVMQRVTQALKGDEEVEVVVVVSHLILDVLCLQQIVDLWEWVIWRELVGEVVRVTEQEVVVQAEMAVKSSSYTTHWQMQELFPRMEAQARANLRASVQRLRDGPSS